MVWRRVSGSGFALAGLLGVALGCASAQAPIDRAAPAQEPAVAALSEGMAAPAVSGLAADGKPIQVADYRGKILILYFYQMDFAAGATAEAEGFGADQAKLWKLGAEIVGVSTDEAQTHRDFAAKYKVTFPLISDAGGQMAQAFGVPLEAGAARPTTFIIDGRGVIRKVWRKLRPWGHSAEVLVAVREIAGK